MNNKTLITIGFLFVVYPATLMFAAEQTGAGNQALEQLRMLQKRLASNNSPQDNKNAKNTSMSINSLPVAPTPAPKTVDTTTSTTTTTTNVETTSATTAPHVSENELIDSMAFDNLSQQLFPLSPEEVVRVKQMYDSAEYAKASPAGVPPKPTATSQFVNLSPGSTPPVIRLSQGFVSSLVFLDSTGAPWPISAYDLGDPSSFNIQWDKTSNTLMIQSSKLYTYGNLAVRLRGLNTPVMLTLIPGQKAVDYRVDLRVQGYGPNAKSMPMEEGLPPSASNILLHVLDGVPPDGSSRLVVSGGDARAWMIRDKMYVRTTLTILSPGWLGSMTSADGMHAYEMQKSPVLLVSWHGKVMQLKVEGL